MSSSKIPTASALGHNGRRRYVSQTDRIDEERLRRRSATAWLRLQAKVQDQADACDLHHTRIVQFRQGEGAFAKALILAARLERRNIDSTPLLEAWIETVLEARGEVDACPMALAVEEQAVDSAEDEAEIAYLSGRGSADDWRRSLIAYVSRAMVTIRALGRAA